MMRDVPEDDVFPEKKLMLPSWRSGSTSLQPRCRVPGPGLDTAYGCFRLGGGYQLDRCPQIGSPSSTHAFLDNTARF
eukprot:1589379-Rhodomonas_salina.4